VIPTSGIGDRLPRGWVVYILRCRDDTLYVGSTNDLARRLQLHAAGRGAKYTRGRGPVSIAYARRCTTEGRARSLEAIVKRLDRTRRLALIAGDAALEGSLLRALAERRRSGLIRSPTPRTARPRRGSVPRLEE
jgi:predicted GIY-YIG superfamily endonuclease